MNYVKESISRGGQDPPDKKIIEKLVKIDKDYTYRVEFDKGKGVNERGSDERGADGTGTSASTSPESVKLYITLWKTRGELERIEREAEKERDRDRPRDPEPRRETDRESKEHVKETEKDEEDKDARTEADNADKETKREAGSTRGRRGRHDKEATATTTSSSSRKRRTRDENRKKNEDMETYCLVGRDDNDLYKAFGRILAECNKDWRKKLDRLDEPRPLK